MNLRLVAIVTAGILALAVVQVTRAGHPRYTSRPDPGERRQFQRGGFGPGPQEDVRLVAKFDRDGDKRLNTDERRAAREYAESLGLSRGRGGPRMRMSGPPTPGPRVDPRSVRSIPASVPFYDPLTIRTLFLTFEDSDWEKQLMVFKPTDVRVPATLVVDGVTYRDVGVQFHGNSSFRGVPEGLKHSMTIAIDDTHDQQRLGGYRTLLLLNSHEDPSLLRAVIYMQIARGYIPAPRANFVHVVINGESWGIYPSVQHFNKDFVREAFANDEGARWKVPGSPNGRGGLQYIGEDVSDYKRTYEIKSDDDARAWAALVALTRVLSAPPGDRGGTPLADQLDVDGALKFLALDNALVNNDGYWTRASDYNIYLDSLGKFHLIPYDVNETFPRSRGAGGRGGNATLDPLVGLGDPSKPLRSRLLAVPALQAKYLGYVRAIATKDLDWKTLGPIVMRYQALIRPYVEADTHKLDSIDAFDDGPATLRDFADQRRAMLLTSLQNR